MEKFEYEPTNVCFEGELKTHLVKVLLTILKTIKLKNNIICEILPDGLKFITEDAKCFQSHVYAPNNCFSTFQISDESESYSFGVDFSHFTEYLTTLPKYSSDEGMETMKLVYIPLKNFLLLELTQTENLEVDEDDDDMDTDDDVGNQGKIVTKYLLKIKNCEEIVDLKQSNENVASTVVLNGRDFYEVINNIHRSVSELDIEVDSRRNIKFKTYGFIRCKTHVKIPKESETILRMDFKQPTKFRYKFTYVKSTLRVLAISSKVGLVTYKDGTLLLQISIEAKDPEFPLFVEYFIVPAIQDFDSDEDGSDRNTN